MEQRSSELLANDIRAKIERRSLQYLYLMNGDKPYEGAKSWTSTLTRHASFSQSTENITPQDNRLSLTSDELKEMEWILTEGNTKIRIQQSKEQITVIGAVPNEKKFLHDCKNLLLVFYYDKDIEAMQFFLRTLFVVKKDAFVPLDWNNVETGVMETTLDFFLTQFYVALYVLEEMYKIMVFLPEFETNK